MALENKARQYPQNCWHGAKHVVVFGNAAGSREVVCIPRGSFLKACIVSVTEAFNGSGVALDIGIAGNLTGIAAAANVGLGTAGYKGPVTAGPLCGDNFFAQDTVILATFNPGTGGTTGRVALAFEFYPQQD